MLKPKVFRLLPIVLLMVMMTISVSARQMEQQPQNDLVTLNLKQVTLKELFSEITQQTGYNFLISMDLARQLPRVDVVAKNESVRKVLEKLFLSIVLAISILAQ